MMSDKGKMSTKEDDGNSSNTNGNDATATSQQQQEEHHQQQEHLDEILSLMQSRAAGKATNEQLEHAVQRMLGPLPVAPAATAASLQQQVARRNVQVDTDDYDDDEDENLKEETAKAKKGDDETVQCAKPAPRLSDADKSSTDNDNKTEIDWAALYGDIPLGKQGARMMQTFGDGSPPLAETVQATLRGARQMIQVAIQDARHVRRQRKKAFHEAQAVLKAETQRLKKRPKTITTKSQNGSEGSKTTTTTTPTTAAAAATSPYQPISQWSPDLLYRVHTGYDSLAYNPPCGFDFEDLEHLFPEEMNAYKRWNRSYQEYADKTQAKEEIKGVGQNQDEQERNNDNDDDDDDDLKSEGQEEQMVVGGHLKERAAQFDIRTDHMKGRRYIEFSELRKGSFLPRRMTVTEEQEMDKSLRTGWGNLPSIAVRFLHWIGFKPGSALPPPNLITAQALGFLAYDFFGRIVEKAIELRQATNYHQKKSSDHNGDDRILLELQPGERLEVNDIEKAMQHPEIRPIPLYRTSDDDKGTTSGTQLYFGPGFEHRLEMELEEIIMASSRDSRKKKKRDEDDEERTKQKEDEDLFQRLTKDQGD